jgi:hypothetical protein
MARVDDSIDFGPRKPYRRYPWDQWANGETWVLTQGEDFDVTVDSFCDTAREWARTHGYLLRSEAHSETTVFLRFVKREEA